MSYLVKITNFYRSGTENLKNDKCHDNTEWVYNEEANAELEKYVNSLRALLNDKISLSQDDKSLVNKSHKWAIGDFLENCKKENHFEEIELFSD